jgi:hypothetical protein
MAATPGSYFRQPTWRIAAMGRSYRGCNTDAIVRRPYLISN